MVQLKTTKTQSYISFFLIISSLALIVQTLANKQSTKNVTWNIAPHVSPVVLLISEQKKKDDEYNSIDMFRLKKTELWLQLGQIRRQYKRYSMMVYVIFSKDWFQPQHFKLLVSSKLASRNPLLNESWYNMHPCINMEA